MRDTTVPLLSIWSQNLHGYQRGDKFAEIADHMQARNVNVILMQEIHEVSENEARVVGMLERLFPWKTVIANLKSREEIEQRYREKQIDVIQQQDLSPAEERHQIRHIDVSKSRPNGGLITMFDTSLQQEGMIQEHYVDPEHLFICTPLHVNEQRIVLINVYAPASKEDRRYSKFLERLTGQMEYYRRRHYKFVVVGDFNSTLDERTDRYSTRARTSVTHDKPVPGIEAWMQRFHLQDAYRHYHKEIAFTFTRTTAEEETVMSRIDHCVVT